MLHLEAEFGVGAQKFVDSASRARELRVVIIVHYDNSLFCQAREDKLEAGFDRFIEVAVTESKGDLSG